MISYLKVRNLAIVEELEIEPGPALNVLTGETGAGKSLLIDSLEFLSGARGSTELIRSGEEKMSAEALFHVTQGDLSPSFPVDIDGSDGEIVVKREIAASGRGRVSINGSLFAVRDLVACSESLLEIHGQDASSERIAGQSFREVVDAWADAAELVEPCRSLHREWGDAATRLASLREASRDRTLRMDLLQYQVDEIGAAAVEADEEEALRREKGILANANELISATSVAFSLLEEGESSALEQLGRALQMIHPLARSVERLRSIEEEIEEARYRLEEAARSLASMSEEVRHDPARLDEVEERLVTIERLKKKYGGSIEAVLLHLENSREELERLTEYEESIEKLESAEAEAFDRYRTAATRLSAARKAAARELEQAIQSELSDLAMERTIVRVVVSAAPDSGSRLTIDGTAVAFGPYGYDRIDILIAPNRGDEPRPMQKIASGGELSRIQLAIAAALFRRSTRSAGATLVFDEIDSGIGGRVAEVVGRKLCELASRNQVICVTHLPQIASLGQTHFHVWKEDVGARTTARIRRLDRFEERVEEIARMLGGERVTESARLHATELLNQSAAMPKRKERRSRSVSTA